MSVLSRPYFHDEAAAFSFVESIIWANGPVCSHCGGTERIYPLVGVRSGKSKKNPEGAVRHGLKKCGQCRGQFTVRIGTIFEESKLPLRIWLQAIALMAASKKGVSAHQLHRTLEITYKSAWFLAHRIREAMREGELAPFGGQGGMVEVDETFIGVLPGVEKAKRAYHHKMKLLTLVDRDSGRARSVVVDGLTIAELAPILEANIAREATLMTDEATHYTSLGWNFADHLTVAHGQGQYVKVDAPHVHTNTVEGFYSIFKRGMRGVYQHCAHKHLHRYAAEFDFRYSHRIANGFDDTQRATKALQGVVGKRLTYAGPINSEGVKFKRRELVRIVEKQIHHAPVGGDLGARHLRPAHLTLRQLRQPDLLHGGLKRSGLLSVDDDPADQQKSMRRLAAFIDIDFVKRREVGNSHVRTS